MDTMIPAIIGGMVMASDCTDWFMPSISPCSLGLARLEMMAMEFGVVRPLNSATKGMTASNIQVSLGKRIIMRAMLRPTSDTFMIWRGVNFFDRGRMIPPWVMAIHMPM